MTLLNNFELIICNDLLGQFIMRYMRRDHCCLQRVSAVLTEKSHGLCDTMDIRLLNNEILIRGRLSLLGNSVMCSV